jgi:glycosyltransferase involved in cell wall biosynthesis
MASGLPVIVSNIPAHRGWVVADRTGVLVDPNDPAAWAEAIVRLFQDPDRGARLSLAAREYVEKHHAFGPQIEQLAELIRTASNDT